MCFSQRIMRRLGGTKKGWWWLDLILAIIKFTWLGFFCVCVLGVIGKILLQIGGGGCCWHLQQKCKFMAILWPPHNQDFFLFSKNFYDVSLLLWTLQESIYWLGINNPFFWKWENKIETRFSLDWMLFFPNSDAEQVSISIVLAIW